MLYLNDTTNKLLSSICKSLCFFRPAKFVPLILNTIYEALEKPDMNFTTTISILTAITIPLVDRTNYKKGLYELPTLLRKVLEVFNSSDF